MLENGHKVITLWANYDNNGAVSEEDEDDEDDHTSISDGVRDRHYQRSVLLQARLGDSSRASKDNYKGHEKTEVNYIANAMLISKQSEKQSKADDMKKSVLSRNDDLWTEKLSDEGAKSSVISQLPGGNQSMLKPNADSNSKQGKQ